MMRAIKFILLFLGLLLLAGCSASLKTSTLYETDELVEKTVEISNIPFRKDGMTKACGCRQIPCFTRTAI
ncbi:hypothetical protein [Clostridium sp. AM58-1XD]|uniref:hypothetical protein n=1 Tax=Clostridium sp. AM58-1XD TaxID=2292307 RepID=UPI000E52FFE8|nr:hypothetical protein [Clostridium sp. AM58-1XD]RGZ01767.1 hypothetical protein DXA13_00080 [Clostridium sp. AM58-1XD]